MSFVGKSTGRWRIGESDGCMDGVRNGDVFALGVNLECGVGANGRRDRAKTLDGGTLIDDRSATQCRVENNAWGYRSEMRRGQR